MSLPDNHRPTAGKHTRKVTPEREVAIRSYIVERAAAGDTSQLIADTVKAEFGVEYDASTIRRWRKQEYEAAKERLRDAADLALVHQLDSLESALSVVMPKAMAGDLRAIDGMLDLFDRQARLLGIYEFVSVNRIDAQPRVIDVVGVDAMSSAG